MGKGEGEGHLLEQARVGVQLAGAEDVRGEDPALLRQRGVDFGAGRGSAAVGDEQFAGFCARWREFG